MASKKSLEGKSAPKIGRPMSFDTDAALRSAMHLFWSKGYHATSLADLTTAMEITPPSLYNAFGTKEELFLAALDTYMDTVGAVGDEVLSAAETAREGIRMLLETTAREQVAKSHPLGCMLIASVNNGSAAPANVMKQVDAYHKRTRDRLLKRLERGIQDGDVAENVDIVALADFYLTTIDGMATLSRNGANLKRLQSIYQLAMQAWP